MMKMGFSNASLGHGTLDSYLANQESELRLLETMKKCLQMKIRCDREYAAALLQAVMQGQKIDGVDNIQESSVLQAWKSVLEDYEFIAKLIKQNSDSLEAKVIEKLNILYNEKRKFKKNFADECGRLTFQLNKMADEVTRKKLEYQKNLELFRIIRLRCEELQHRGTSMKQTKKVDDVKEKYYKARKKLHQVHNEYVLLLAEAVEFEKNYRTVLVPGLLETYEATQERFIDDWKSILNNVAKNSTLCTEQFTDLESRIVKIIEGIRPFQEGMRLIEKHSSKSPSDTIFSFDNSLFDTALKLEPNKLVVDNWTVDWLRSRLSELDATIKSEQDKMLEMGEHILTASRTNNDQENRSVSTEITRKRRELLELRCEERKLSRQLDIVKAALSTQQSFQELPSGCECDGFDVSDSTQLEFEDHGISRPPSSQSLQQKKPFSTLLNRVRLRATPTTFRKTAPRVTPDKESSGARNLFEEEWFHGVLPREEVVRLLKKEGDFLLRETTRNEENQTVLSVAWGGHKHFIVQTTPEGLYRFEGPTFPTIQELIVHQYQSGLPVTARSGAVLKRPILRERWELNNDDVILLDKIGRGNFGDVYKARLKKTNQEVAVKTCRMTLPDEQKKKFLQEGRILKQYDHPNVVKLVGICVQKQPIMIVMELVPGGSLLTFLRNNATTLTEFRLLRMCQDVAAGMRYLESKNCIHRDLAARNCLIGYDEIVKISDFGMSREEEEYIVSDGMKQIPIKWTAPEALNFGKYTSLCDVWSYGVLAWEVFAKGDVPYPGLSNSKAREKIDSGYRMSPADGTPDDMYKLMLRCWEYEAEKRPHFDEICTIIQDIRNKRFPND